MILGGIGPVGTEVLNDPTVTSRRVVFRRFALLGHETAFLELGEDLGSHFYDH